MTLSSFLQCLPLILAMMKLPAAKSLAIDSQISAQCREQAQNFLRPLNTSGTICASELLQMFNETNDLGFSPTQTECIGATGIQICFQETSDPNVVTGISFADSTDTSACPLCNPTPSGNRSSCQELLEALALNVTMTPGLCSTPKSPVDPLTSDLSLLVFLRFQLDIRCEGFDITTAITPGFMSDVPFLPQCQCGAIPCPPGYLCKANTFPVNCPAGSYCPDFAGGSIQCPKGSYCPEGASDPIECPSGSLCPAGSKRHFEYLPFLFVCISLLVGWASFLYYKRRTESILKANERACKNDVTNESVEVNRQRVRECGVDKTDQRKATLSGGQDVGASSEFKNGTGFTSPAAQSETQQRGLNLDESRPLEAIELAAINMDILSDHLVEGGKRKLSISFEEVSLRHAPPKGCCFGVCATTNISQNASLRIDSDGLITRLKSVSGRMKVGTLTGVMGPSGSGKSTFLNVLCGKLAATSGKIQVNGQLAKLTDFRKQIGFVPQQDIVDSRLRVREALLFSASLRLAKSKEKHQAIVQKTLKILGLWHVRDSIIGDEFVRGVSGGEKKRVNIGIELVGGPSALFLDEPTTGLDATAALKVAEILHKLAKTNQITVCAVIHQPRPLIVDKFDNLLLLAKGGRVAWHGKAVDAMKHFVRLGYCVPSNVDYPDFFSDVISGVQSPGKLKHGSLIYEKDEKTQQLNVANIVTAFRLRKSSLDYKDTKDIDESLAESKNVKSVSEYSQCVSYFERGMYLRFLRTNRIAVDATAYLVAGLIIGMIFNDVLLLGVTPSVLYGRNCPGNSDSQCFIPTDFVAARRFGFYNAMALGIVAVSTGTVTFAGQRKLLFWRDASAGASPSAYFFGEVLCDMTTVWISSLVYTSIVQLMVPLRGPFLLYWLLWTVSVFVMHGLSYVMAIGILEMGNATIAGVIMSIVLTMFEGFIDLLGNIVSHFSAILKLGLEIKLSCMSGSMVLHPVVRTSSKQH
mmetsp:Transcript_6341/g.8825  ORF Transcript_6341/g.8825 Transcript_6341/m.8825 type:complete len:979 (+) Transcript_6341:93-3029(+)